MTAIQWTATILSCVMAVAIGATAGWAARHDRPIPTAALNALAGGCLVVVIAFAAQGGLRGWILGCTWAVFCAGFATLAYRRRLP